ncbi:mechanosensitive ion channel domain-containing protein [Pseudomonadota bacterium]
MAQKHSINRYLYSVVATLFFSALLFIATSSLVNAEQVQSDDWLSQATATIKKHEKSLKDATPEKSDIETLAKDLEEINQIKDQAQECIANAETQLLKTTEDLTTLGEPAAKEAFEVVKKRRSLTAQQKELDKQLASCKLLLLQSQDLVKSINELQQGILAQQLSARTPHIITVLADNIKAPTAFLHDSLKFLHTQYRLEQLNAEQFTLLILLAAIGIVSGVFLDRHIRAVKSPLEKPKDSVSAFALAVRTSLAQALPILLPVIIAAAFLSFTLPLSPLPFITKASYMLGVYLGLIILINVLLCPAAPANIYLTGPEALSRRFARQLKILTTLLLIAVLLFTGEFKASLSEPVYYLGRTIFAVLLIFNLIVTVWLVRQFSWAILTRGARAILSLILITSLLAELAGYRNLSFFVVGGLLATSFSLGLTLLVYRLIKDLFDGLDEGRLEWERKLRSHIGLKKGAMVPGLIWLRIIIFLGLWGGFAFLALNIWQLDDPWLAIITSSFTDGFLVGSLKVTPTLLAGGVLAFVIILNLTRYIKNHILPHGLKYTNLDRGAREAVTSLVGYTGVAAAILIALSITGVEMQNIAIIAGALSVGIGFGLQNIVNNFISGLILLFERPVRRGDWIVTGDTEGYVKAINIRSTQIETFDKADVIVPNSELITAKVTNWMLRDPYGRISIPIGVGYDSDVEKVKQILLDIANGHSMVIKDHPQLSAPKVLFRNFGENSLDFELRCFIRDIDKRLNIISEFNFSIITAFRQEGIEIPFPQRVVTVSNWQDQNDPKTGDAAD